MCCYGLEVKFGGIVLDLCLLEIGVEGDEWFKEWVINGVVCDGVVYMLKMVDFIS